MKSKKRMFAVAAVVAGLIAPASVFAQPGGGRGDFRGGMFGGGEGVLGLLQRDEVRQEIQLVDEQQQQLESLGDEIRTEMRDMFGQMRDLGDDERRARFDEIRARMEEIRADAESRVQRILLPHQFERLKQIDVQARIQRQGASALTGGQLAETLGLTPEQQEKLRARAEEVQREMEEQIRQLRLEARNKVLEVLTAEQRAKLDGLMGEQFDVPDQGFGFRGRGDRGTGGRFGRGDRGRND
jgi:Spy/CpxP family protein refolding chaperone